MNRPLIGVTTSRRGGWRSYLMHRLALARVGARSVRLMSGHPLPEEPLHGLVIGGGDDIGAEIYGGTVIPDVRIDPERDKPELLKAYLESFDPGFVALRGSPEQLKEVAKEFKVYYAKVPGKTPDSYTMDHTAASFLFDPQGRVRVFSRYGAGATALMSDIKALLAGQ